MRFDGSAVPATLANRFLERESWAQACLATHAGRVFALVVGPVVARMRIDATGKIESVAPARSACDLTLKLSPLGLPALLAEPARWNDLVVAEGDQALAATLKGLAETVPWFVERGFAEALGPIVGQRVADGGRKLLAFPRFAVERIGDSIASFVREEANFAASLADTRSFAAEVAEALARVEAIERRVEQLAARLGAGPHSI